MAKTFELKIELGNDAMQTVMDVSTALVRVANKVRSFSPRMMQGASGKILDGNGNSVGRWSFNDGEEKEEESAAPGSGPPPLE